MATSRSRAFLTDKYGDPCAGCGWSWGASADEVAAVVAHAVERFGAITMGCSGQERTPGLDWNVTSYVFHVADNTRIWAERLAASALDWGAEIAPYDENALDAARSAGESALAGALWSLDRAIADWHAAVALTEDDTRLAHPNQGPMTVLEVSRCVAHELHHHALDVERLAAC